ncbi:choice-of-anchor P family protein [Actinokineospora soli]|uniref:Choice-of-anchor P family protein n=1 Tax=Actinokineospora soli TaxID=1048753 RepID=A0ABW2TQ20_9PSEU
MRSTRLFILASGVTAAALAVGSPALATGPTGSAFAISVQATLLNSLQAGVGPLPAAAYPAGADKSVVSLAVLKDTLAKARVLNASSSLAGGTLTSKASIAEVSALGLIEAKLVTAECTSVNGVATGSAKLVDVKVGGTKIEVGAPSTSIKVSDIVQVHVNEQVYANGKLTVNAVRVSVGGKVGGVARADVILSQAVCSGGKPDDGDGGDNGGTPTTTPAPTTAPGDGGTTTTPAPTTAPGDGGDNGGTPTAPGGGDTPGITPVAGEEDLADTGVSAVVPLSIGGLALLAGGGAALYYVRRRSQA